MEYKRLTDHERIIDNTEGKILELIEETSDSKDKGFLLILLKLNNSLGDNTKVVNDVANKLNAHMTVFESHAQQEFAEYHRRDGAKKIWNYVIGAIQTVAISMILYFQAELVTLHADVNKMKLDLVRHEVIIDRNTKIISG